MAVWSGLARRATLLLADGRLGESEAAAFEALLRGEPALMIFDGEAMVGVITRSDLLEFVAHRGR